MAKKKNKKNRSRSRTRRPGPPGQPDRPGPAAAQPGVEARPGEAAGGGPADRTLFVCFVLYALVTSFADSFAYTAGFESFHWLRWQLASGWDVYKLVFWLFVPVVLSWRFLDPGWVSPRRMTRADWGMLLVVALGGAVAMGVIQYDPALRAHYPSFATRSWEFKRRLAGQYFAWQASWLPGWELMFRGLILSRATAIWPRRGWLWLPLLEGLTHLLKPPLEAVGMVFFSVVLTLWATRRRCLLPGFLAHAIVEVELLVFQFLV